MKYSLFWKKLPFKIFLIPISHINHFLDEELKGKNVKTRLYMYIYAIFNILKLFFQIRVLFHPL